MLVLIRKTGWIRKYSVGTAKLCCTGIHHLNETIDRTTDMLGELELAYAMTVHKSQGSEYRAVIMSVFQGSPLLLTRSVLYTGVKCARQLLILVGNEEMIAQMVANNRQTKRYSGLKLRIEANVS